jgi:hypothetical protein
MAKVNLCCRRRGDDDGDRIYSTLVALCMRVRGGAGENRLREGMDMLHVEIERGGRASSS